MWFIPIIPLLPKTPGNFLTAYTYTEEDKKQNFVQSRHYSFREDNKHFYINDQENPYEETKRFDWIQGRYCWWPFLVMGKGLLPLERS